jgi:hypothetical protein
MIIKPGNILVQKVNKNLHMCYVFNSTVKLSELFMKLSTL